MRKFLCRVHVYAKFHENPRDFFVDLVWNDPPMFSCWPNFFSAVIMVTGMELLKLVRFGFWCTIFKRHLTAAPEMWKTVCHINKNHKSLNSVFLYWHSMHEMCESLVSINAKQYVPFKRSLFTPLSYVKSFPVQLRNHTLRCKGSWTVLHSCFFVTQN